LIVLVLFTNPSYGKQRRTGKFFYSLQK
jgi:hypothetical protein